jgi:hypothetical protein
MRPEDVKNWDPDRVYRINYVDDTFTFVPGHNAAGEQVLAGGVSDELLVAFYFDAEGHYLRLDFRPVAYTPDPSLFVGEQRLQRAYAFQETQREWLRELGLTGGTIRVRHFAFPEWGIGTAAWPHAWFPEVQRALAAGEPLEGEFLQEWQREGMWVLHWRNDFWMTADGDVGGS